MLQDSKSRRGTARQEDYFGWLSITLSQRYRKNRSASLGENIFLRKAVLHFFVPYLSRGRLQG
jgi:hypothetical protein